MAFENLRGLVVSPFTIFKEDDSLDAQGLAYNVDYLVREVWSSLHTVLCRVHAEHPIVWAKAWSEVVGMKGRGVRSPGKNLDPDQKAEFQSRVRDALHTARQHPIFQTGLFLES
jgi:dihydrodipicolinate synthase/N-acetylneuraminate lyase